MFKEDMETRLTRTLTRKEQAADNQEQSKGHTSPTKRRAKPTGRRTGGIPCNKPREMSLNTIEKPSATKATTKATTKDTTVSSETASENSSLTSETSAPSPKRLNQKNTSPATTSTSAIKIPTRRSVCHRQSTSAKALSDPIPINTIDKA